MLKRGLSLLIFLVLLSSIVCAWSTISPDNFYEGSSNMMRILINNTAPGSTVITELNVSAPGITITEVPAIAGWDSTNTAVQVQWVNGTVETNVEAATFRFRIIAPSVAADTNLTFAVTKTNGTGASVTENNTIQLLNDATPPVIASLNPDNSTLANVMQTITANVQENQSQLNNVTYTYGTCNGTNTTLVLTCNGSICTGSADFTNCGEGNTTWYTLVATNNVGGTNITSGNITFHGMPPNVTAVTPAAGTMYTESEAIYITANATDDGVVDTVRADVTYPNGTTEAVVLNLAAGNKYSRLFNAPNLMGQYNVTIVANDTSGNVNNTETTNFKIVPDYTFTVALNPSTVRPGRSVRISGTVKLSNGSNIPENQVAIDVRGTETNVTLTNGSFSHTFSAPQSDGNHNIYVRVYANSGYNYSSRTRLTVNSPYTNSGNGWDSDWGGGSGSIITEDAGVAEAPEEEIIDEDAGVAKAPEEAITPTVNTTPTPEEVIDEILSKPGNQITGSAVGLGTGTTILAMILLMLGLATLAYSNVRIRDHVHKFAKENVGGKFKKKAPKDEGFSDQEWEEYFKRLKED